MESARQAISVVKIFTDYIGRYYDRFMSFVSFFPKDPGETPDEYESRLVRNINSNAFYIDGENTVRMTRNNIIPSRVLYGEGRGGRSAVPNTVKGRNDIYDNMNVPWSNVTEYVENQLLGCVYQVESIMSQRDRLMDQEFLFVFYENAVRVYEVVPEFYIRPGKIIQAKLLSAKCGSLSISVAEIEGTMKFEEE